MNVVLSELSAERSTSSTMALKGLWPTRRRCAHKKDWQLGPPRKHVTLSDDDVPPVLGILLLISGAAALGFAAGLLIA
jgi:hypothetical protein